MLEFECVISSLNHRWALKVSQSPYIQISLKQALWREGGHTRQAGKGARVKSENTAKGQEKRWGPYGVEIMPVGQ